MNRVKHWYFKIKYIEDFFYGGKKLYNKGDVEIVSYGDSSRYTKEEARAKMKEKQVGCAWILLDEEVE